MQNRVIIFIACALLILPAVTADAHHTLIAKKTSNGPAPGSAESLNINCPKCQNAMEEGYVLDVQGVDAANTKAPSDWIQGPPESSFWSGVNLHKRAKRRIEALRCTACGYLELYAR